LEEIKKIGRSVRRSVRVCVCVHVL